MRRVQYILYLHLYYYHRVDTSDGKLLVPEGITRPVVSAAALTWFITYVVQFSNHMINIKTKVLLHHT
jgi:hypothetical protein